MNTQKTQETNPAAACPPLSEGLERDSARDTFYKGADRGEPMHWRDIGPDELWAAAWDAGAKAERRACAQVCGDRAKAASIACDAGAYYEAEECEDAILKRSNVELRWRAL